MEGPTPKPGRRKIWALAGVAAAAWAVAVAAIYGYERATLHAEQNVVTYGVDPIEPMHEFAIPGIVRPPIIEAGSSILGPDEEVIGVEVGGRARAYRLDAFRDRSRHLVNDVLGESPVSVVYCDIANCVRAYTDPNGHDPLGLAVAGLFGGKAMVLEVDGAKYFQESGAPLKSGVGSVSIPLERLSPIRTTWAEWKRLHPSTDVYEGIR